MLTHSGLERFPENISIWNKRPNHQNLLDAVVFSITELVLKHSENVLHCK